MAELGSENPFRGDLNFAQAAALTEAARLELEALTFLRMGYEPSELCVIEYEDRGAVWDTQIVPKSIVGVP